MSVSVDEKVRIALKLDELGIHFIEGGFPASNPKEVEFFARMERERLTNAELVAFGMTRRKRRRRRPTTPACACSPTASPGYGDDRRQDLGPAPQPRCCT